MCLFYYGPLSSAAWTYPLYSANPLLLCPFVPYSRIEVCITNIHSSRLQTAALKRFGPIHPCPFSDSFATVSQKRGNKTSVCMLNKNPIAPGFQPSISRTLKRPFNAPHILIVDGSVKRFRIQATKGPRASPPTGSKPWPAARRRRPPCRRRCGASSKRRTRAGT